ASARLQRLGHRTVTHRGRECPAADQPAPPMGRPVHLVRGAHQRWRDRGVRRVARRHADAQHRIQRRLGWAFTVNTYDGADLYRLSLHDGGYAWDGGVRAFDVTRDSIRIRQEDGSVSAEPFDIVRSVHGPVIAQSGDAAVALR